jgi:nitrite reductase/ring-hydroxylating ferredoxin subunit
MAEFAAVAREGDLGEGEMRAFDVRGTKIAVANVGGAFHAFDVTSGMVLQGPARKPLATYETRVEGGNLEVEG